MAVPSLQSSDDVQDTTAGGNVQCKRNHKISGAGARITSATNTAGIMYDMHDINKTTVTRNHMAFLVKFIGFANDGHIASQHMRALSPHRQIQPRFWFWDFATT